MKKILLLSALLLSACASTGAPYQPAQHGGTQLVVYRPSSLMLAIRSPDIVVNGQKTCESASGRYFTLDVAPGTITIEASLFDMPGTSRLTFNAVANSTTYVRVFPNTGAVIGAATFGLGGAIIASENRGPFEITLPDPDTAIMELTKSNFSCK